MVSAYVEILTSSVIFGCMVFSQIEEVGPVGSLNKYKLKSSHYMEIQHLSLASEVLKDDLIRPLCEAHVAAISKNILTDYLHAVRLLLLPFCIFHLNS